MRTRWTPRAALDVDLITAYIAERDASAAQRIARRIIRSVELLKAAPYRGRPGRVDGTRELVVPRTPYIVAYALRDGEARILRVLHSARRWPSDL